MKKIVDWLLALLLFLLPVKFGGLAVMPESGGFYPDNFSDWLYLPLPPHSLAFFGSAILILALFRNSPAVSMVWSGSKTGVNGSATALNPAPA